MPHQGERLHLAGDRVHDAENHKDEAAEVDEHGEEADDGDGGREARHYPEDDEDETLLHMELYKRIVFFRGDEGHDDEDAEVR